jgi:DNA integrity scanning protein DisA with diadenylate cyclase activity
MTMPWFFNTYDFYLGTSWDLAKMNEINSKQMMKFIAEGLVNILRDIEKGIINKKTKFKGNTFYFKESTIKRFGFNTRRMNLFETILFILNYFELCLLSSIVKKKFTFIPVKNVMIVIFNAEEILANKNKFETMLALLKNRKVKEQSKQKIKSALKDQTKIKTYKEIFTPVN